ncbi:UNVERIFIED_CONTAM: hypothetical protein GTU68_000832 [Idotea baltica]|nr:hypothetical protein [Idotea baltica]
MNYKVPLRDIKFVREEVLDMSTHYNKFTKGQAAEPDLVEAILEEAAKFCENELVPLNKVGDEEGCHFKNGEVTTPKGFKETYKDFIANGWPGLTAPTEYGGQGLPESIGLTFMEMLISSNHSWSMYPGLTLGAIKTVYSHATQDIKDRFMPPMVSGDWTGTMCLTEPHCGSDLGLLKSYAVADDDSDEDGAYKISGSKIFISSGEHDMADNIMHIVLARLPDAPAGIKGISLFLVPKVLVNKDGSLGERNTVTCGSIEEKMGIHGNSTCVMNFDDAKGYLISEPNKGMRAMFTFINESRLGVGTTGIQGLDLLGRKILKTRGAAIKPLMELFDEFVSENRWNKHGRRFKSYLKKWKSLTRSVGFKVMKGDMDELNGAAVEYLMFAGYVTLGYFWSKAAIISEQAIEKADGNENFYRAKIETANFYYERLMPRADALIESIGNGADSMMAMDVDNFIFFDS